MTTRVRPPMPYPKPFQVDLASQAQLGRCLDLLLPPATDSETALMERIRERFGGWTPDVINRLHWTTRNGSIGNPPGGNVITTHKFSTMDELIREHGDELRKMDHETYERLVLACCIESPARKSSLCTAKRFPETRFTNVLRGRVLTYMHRLQTGDAVGLDDKAMCL